MNCFINVEETVEQEEIEDDVIRLFKEINKLVEDL
jgi:hypothetical protein